MLGTVQRSQLARNRLGAIRRVVVHNHNLIVEALLLEHAAQQEHDDRQVLALIIRRENHTALEWITYLYLCPEADAATASPGISITEVIRTRTV